MAGGCDETADDRILSLLGVNSRMGIDKIADETGMTRACVYGAVKRLAKELDITFVPEIGIRNLWRYEFLGLSWGKSKKELLESIIQPELQSPGFEEYVAMIEFKGKAEPTDSDILKSTKGSYIPQYIARTSGQYDVFMYLIARDSIEVSNFIYEFRNSLSGFELTVKLQFIYPQFGYFPLNDKFIEQTHIQSRYKKLLMALNKDTRVRLATLAGEFGGVSKMAMSAMHARLRELGLMERPTICIRKPKEQLIKIFTLSILSSKKFFENRDKLLMNIVENSEKRYVFIADIRNPDGIMIIARFSSMFEIEQFKKDFVKLDLGVEFLESTILKNVSGSLGIRNFMKEKTVQYAMLKAKGIVGKRGETRAEEGKIRSKKDSVSFTPIS